MKGALSAMLAAALYYAEDANYGFPGDIYVAGVVHEECFEGVKMRYHRVVKVSRIFCLHFYIGNDILL